MVRNNRNREAYGSHGAVVDMETAMALEAAVAMEVAEVGEPSNVRG